VRQAPQRQRDAGNDARQQYNNALNDAIKESKDPEVAKLKVEIDGVKKLRNEAIAKVKESRRRLSYKEAEAVAITRLLAIEKGKDANNAKRRKIGYLKRLKNQLEFKIATEASSLAAEKDFVRKIEEVNKELNDAYKAIRLERKSEFLKKDAEDYKKLLAELELKIAEHDKKLDELYDKLRKLLGIERGRHGKPASVKKKPQARPMSQEINLEDIAVIKKKAKKPEEADDA
jgi:uncharacterized coiled-coil DUF342 family protein